MINLKHVDICIYEEHSKLKKLFSNIHNAPFLEYVKLSRAPITLVDLELLHRSLPKLEVLYLCGAAPFDNDNDGERWGITQLIKPANRMKSLILYCSEASTKWLSCVGGKYYPTLETLKVS